MAPFDRIYFKLFSIKSLSPLDSKWLSECIQCFGLDTKKKRKLKQTCNKWDFPSDSI
jgi:endonuclease III